MLKTEVFVWLIVNTFTYQETLLNTLFCLFLKSSEAFSVSLSDQNA